MTEAKMKSDSKATTKKKPSNAPKQIADRTAKKAIFVDGDKFTVTATIKGGKTGKAYMIFKVADIKAAESALMARGLRSLSQEDISLI